MTGAYKNIGALGILRDHTKYDRITEGMTGAYRITGAIRI